MSYTLSYAEDERKIIKHRNTDEKIETKNQSFISFLKTLSEKGIISMNEIKKALNESNDEFSDEINAKLDTYSSKILKRIK